MKSKHAYSAVMMMGLAVICAGTAEPGPAEIKLAQDGKALVKIVRPANPIPAETRVVQELSDYLTKSTGAKFEVIDEKDAVANASFIYVGPTEFAKKQGVNSGQLGKEESVIKTVGENLIITGGRPRGVLYGIYVFLEDYLGVHWLNLWCEVVPSNATLAVKPIDVRRKPFMEYREQYADPRHLISLRIGENNTLIFETADPSAKPVAVTAESSSGKLADGQWHLVVAGHDKEAKRLFLRLDDQPLQETALAEAPLVEEPIWIGGGVAGFLKWPLTRSIFTGTPCRICRAAE